MDYKKERSILCNSNDKKNDNKSGSKINSKDFKACGSKNNQRSKNLTDTKCGNTSKCSANHNSKNDIRCNIKKRLRSAFRNGRCQKPQYRNPFFNFLRDYRKRNTNLTIIEVAKFGAKEWNILPGEAKQRYREEASTVPKVQRSRKRTWQCANYDSTIECCCSQRKRRRPRSKSKCRSKARSKSRSRSRSRSRSKRRSSKCQRKNPCGPLCSPQKRLRKRRKLNKCEQLLYGSKRTRYLNSRSRSR